MFKAIGKKIPGVRMFYNLIKRGSTELYPRGHFYSPLPDLGWVRAYPDTLFRKDIDIGNSIDLHERSQKSLLSKLVPYYIDFDFPEEPTKGTRYYSKNPMFGIGSAFSLYAMLRYFDPKHVIEVGSGFSSALVLDVSERYLQSQTLFTFIEPYPERLCSLLQNEHDQRCQIHAMPVQETPHATFEVLNANDILFVDSSHVSRIGSDVNYLIFYILPRLNSGVIIHFHDIYWPFEYPET